MELNFKLNETIGPKKYKNGEAKFFNNDRDGMQTGYDINLINSVKKKLQIPLIAGGASNEEDFVA